MGVLSRLFRIFRVLIFYREDELGEGYSRSRQYNGYSNRNNGKRNSFHSKTRYKYTKGAGKGPGGDGGFDPELARYYANLEIPYNSDLNTVKKAWKRMLMKYHPDIHCGDPERERIAQEIAKGINTAYEKICERFKS
ncbi:MAG: DnaJ domain-containing protein [Fidelibacterota bacterium]